MFKLDTKARVSANRFKIIPTTQTVRDRINEMAAVEKQQEGVQFTDKDGKVTINDMDLNLNDNGDDDSKESESSITIKNTKTNSIRKRKQESKILSLTKYRTIISTSRFSNTKP